MSIHDVLSPQREIFPSEKEEAVLRIYTPAGDTDRIRQRLATYREKIAAGEILPNELIPATNPYAIRQGEFALTEQHELRLVDVFACLGVTLMNEATGRTLAAHIEARVSDTAEIAVRDTVEQMHSTFRDYPTLVVLNSLHADQSDLYDFMRARLGALFSRAKFEMSLSPNVRIVPTLRAVSFPAWIPQYDEIRKDHPSGALKTKRK